MFFGLILKAAIYSTFLDLHFHSRHGFLSFNVHLQSPFLLFRPSAFRFNRAQSSSHGFLILHPIRIHVASTVFRNLHCMEEIHRWQRLVVSSLKHLS